MSMPLGLATSCALIAAGLLLAGLGLALVSAGSQVGVPGFPGVILGGAAFVAGWLIAAVGAMTAGFAFGRRQ